MDGHHTRAFLCGLLLMLGLLCHAAPPDILPEYLAKLKTATGEERTRLIQIIGEFEDARAAEALVGVIPTDTSAALWNLRFFGPLAVDYLIRAYHETTTKRSNILNSLNTIYANPTNGLDPHDPRYVELLLSAAGDADSNIRRTAFYGFCNSGPEPSGRVTAALCTLLRDTKLIGNRLDSNTLKRFRVPAVKTVLLEHMNSADASVRSNALNHLRLFKDDHDVITVASTALHDPGTFESARYLLYLIGTPEAVQSLVSAFDTTDNDSRDFIIMTLGAIPTPDAGAALHKIAFDPARTARNRANARRALGQAGTDAILATWEQADARTRHELLYDIADLADPRASTILLTAYPTLKASERELIRNRLFERKDAGATRIENTILTGPRHDLAREMLHDIYYHHRGWVETATCLTTLFTSTDDKLREYVVLFLSNEIRPDMTSLLITALHDKSREVRNDAAFALSIYRDDPKVCDALVAALDDRTVCEAAAHALGLLGDSRVIPFMLQRLHAHETWPLWYCDDLRDPRFVPYLLKQVTSNNTNYRQNAISCLGTQGDSRATPVLLAMLQKNLHLLASLRQKQETRKNSSDTNPMQVEPVSDIPSIIGALSALGGPEVTDALFPLARNEGGDYQGIAINALCAMHDTCVIPIILQLLQAHQHTIFTTATWLTKLGTPAYPTALTMLTDPRPWVRRTGTEVLANLGKPEAGISILPLLDDSQPRVQEAAIKALDTLHTVAAGPALLPFLSSDRPPLRAAAARAVGTLAVRESLPALRIMLTDPYSPAQYSAASSLALLGDDTGMPILREGAQAMEYSAKELLTRVENARKAKP
jgi:HEAT repeat protein